MKVTPGAAREPSPSESPALDTQQRWAVEDGEEQEHMGWVECAKTGLHHDNTCQTGYSLSSPRWPEALQSSLTL